MLLVRRRDVARMVERMEKAHNVRGLLRVVRQGQRTESGELLYAIQALARLRDPRVGMPLHTAYEQMAGCVSTPMALAYGTALAAIGDLHALHPLAQVLALEVSHPELVTSQERELEQAASALRSLGCAAFDALAPSFSRWAVPRHYRAPSAEEAQARGSSTSNHRQRVRPANGAATSASLAWLTPDSAYLLAGASGDARAIDVLTPALIDHFGCADGAAGAALGLGWLGATQAVDALIAALLMGVVLERLDWLRTAQPSRDVPPSIEALWRDVDTELTVWHREVRDAHAPQAALGPVSLATIAALGRLRCQQAAVPLLLATIHRAQQQGSASDGFAQVMSTSLRRTGGLPIVRAVADAVQTDVSFNLRLQCVHVLHHLGVDLPAHDPLYAPRVSAKGASAGPAAQTFALFPTQVLRVLVRFATNPHLRQLVREELARRRVSATW